MLHLWYLSLLFFFQFHYKIMALDVRGGG
jgi:hypothetical protein